MYYVVNITWMIHFWHTFKFIIFLCIFHLAVIYYLFYYISALPSGTSRLELITPLSQGVSLASVTRCFYEVLDFFSDRMYMYIKYYDMLTLFGL